MRKGLHPIREKRGQKLRCGPTICAVTTAAATRTDGRVLVCPRLVCFAFPLPSLAPRSPPFNARLRHWCDCGSCVSSHAFGTRYCSCTSVTDHSQRCRNFFLPRQKLGSPKFLIHVSLQYTAVKHSQKNSKQETNKQSHGGGVCVLSLCLCPRSRVVLVGGRRS